MLKKDQDSKKPGEGVGKEDFEILLNGIVKWMEESNTSDMWYSIGRGNSLKISVNRMGEVSFCHRDAKSRDKTLDNAGKASDKILKIAKNPDKLYETWSQQIRSKEQSIVEKQTTEKKSLKGYEVPFDERKLKVTLSPDAKPLDLSGKGKVGDFYDLSKGGIIPVLQRKELLQKTSEIPFTTQTKQEIGMEYKKEPVEEISEEIILDEKLKVLSPGDQAKIIDIINYFSGVKDGLRILEKIMEKIGYEEREQTKKLSPNLRVLAVSSELIAYTNNVTKACELMGNLPSFDTIKKNEQIRDKGIENTIFLADHYNISYNPEKLGKDVDETERVVGEINQNYDADEVKIVDLFIRNAQTLSLLKKYVEFTEDNIQKMAYIIFQSKVFVESNKEKFSQEVGKKIEEYIVYVNPVIQYQENLEKAPSRSNFSDDGSYNQAVKKYLNENVRIFEPTILKNMRSYLDRGLELYSILHEACSYELILPLTHLLSKAHGALEQAQKDQDILNSILNYGKNKDIFRELGVKTETDNPIEILDSLNNAINKRIGAYKQISHEKPVELSAETTSYQKEHEASEYEQTNVPEKEEPRHNVREKFRGIKNKIINAYYKIRKNKDNYNKIEEVESEEIKSDGPPGS